MGPLYPITAIGRVDIDFPDIAAEGLRPLGRDLLAMLIAAGPEGVEADELAWVRGDAQPLTSRSLRNEMSRLREHFPPDGLPRARSGRYRLDVAIDDVDVWHLEALAAAPDDTVDAPRLRHLLRPVAPFAGSAGGESIADATFRVRAQQRALLTAGDLDGLSVLQADFIDQLVEHVEDDPLNERLIYVASSQLARVGDRRGGLSLIGRAIREYHRIGLPISEELARLEGDLRDGTFDVAGDSDESRRTHPMPTQLAARQIGRYVGPQDALDTVTHLIDTAPVGMTAAVVTGRSGAGKTRLCAEAAVHAIEREWAVAYVAPTSLDDQVPFAPMAAAVPGLRDRVAEILASDRDVDSVRVALWAAADAALEEIRRGSPLMLVVDDTQWLDEATASWISHVATARVDYPVMLVVNGRADAGESRRWDAVRVRLEALGAERVDIARFAEHDLRALVHDHRPALNGVAVASVSRELLERTGGLPGVATPLIRALDEASTALPTAGDLARDELLGPAIGSLDDIDRRVGLAVAVLDEATAPTLIAQIADVDIDAVIDALEELEARHLLTDLGGLRFEVAHVLAQAALLDASTTRDIARCHLRAAEHFADDVHRRARHGVSARPYVDDDVVVTWLLESAHHHVTGRSWRAAIRAFHAAAEVDPAALQPHDRGAMARALDLTAARETARDVRQIGVDEALERGDAELALAIATSGLPEAELIEGDADIVNNLSRIDATQLAPEQAFRHAICLSRQLVMSGMSDLAAPHVERAVALASSSDERIGAALVQRLDPAIRERPRRRLELMQSVAPELADASDPVAGDYLLNLALDHHETGDLDGSARTVGLLEALDDASVVKQWQSQMMRALWLTDAGQMGAANATRLAAYEFAVAAGLGEADNALLAGLFIDLWLRQSTAGYMTEIDGGVLDPSVNQLTKAGAAIVCHDAGEHERATRYAVEVCRDVLRSNSGLGQVALAMTAQPLMDSGDRDLIDGVRDTLEPRGNSMLVIGAGAANVGPIARYRARLSDDPDEKMHHLTEALDLAERSGSLLWRAVAHRSLGRLTGEQRWFDRLRSLVAGTELEDLAAPV